jgi:hypothetical protein
MRRVNGKLGPAGIQPMRACERQSFALAVLTYPKLRCAPGRESPPFCPAAVFDSGFARTESPQALDPVEIGSARIRFPTSHHSVMMMALFEIAGLRNSILKNVGEVSPEKGARFLQTNICFQ